MAALQIATAAHDASPKLQKEIVDVALRQMSLASAALKKAYKGGK